jgi:regulator of nucleoside diphosphate kinase
MNQTAITVSERDYERIDALLDKTGDNVPGIRELRAELERSDVLPSEQMPVDVVTMNSTVVFENIATGKRFELALVYPHDMDANPGKVSILAPVGSALLGLAVDQTIQWQMPGGNALELRVLEVRDQPEARQR